MARKYTPTFQQWRLFYKTRNTFFIKKYWKPIFALVSGYITFLGILFYIFLPDWLLAINIVLLITVILLMPILFFITIFVSSLRPKWRDELDEWIGYGGRSTKERLSNLETKLGDIETTLKDINDKLDKHIQEKQ
jgi:ABC-type multidrug transport system fused ATPase/permease subunit